MKYIMFFFVFFSNVCFAEQKSIFILSAPRTTSTLMMRFFSQPIEQSVIKGNILLEPCTQIFHDQIPGKVPGYNPQEEWPHSHEQAMSLIATAQKNFVIAKDLAYQTSFSDLDLKFIAKHYHVLFLIRNPVKTIPSNLFPYFKEGCLETFDENAVGFKALGELFNRFVAVTNITPWVIDAEDYLKEPKQTFEAYFKAFNIEWNDNYLHLKAKTEEDKTQDIAYKVWPDWYKNAYSSTGVSQGSSHKKPSPYAELIKQETKLIKHLLEESFPAYETIKSQGLRP